MALCNIIQQVSADKTVLAPGDVLCVSFRLSRPATVTVVIVDSDLQTVKTTALGSLAAGRHVARWDATQADGRPAPPEVYTWQIEARAADGLHTWEPANLHSRPAEQLSGVAWDQQAKTIRIDVPSAMRAWVRVGLHAGACVRTLVNGQAWMPGRPVVPWDGRDDSGVVEAVDRTDWYITAFGYRLPRPCVMVMPGPNDAHAEARPCTRLGLDPPIRPEDPPWTWVRAFCLTDHLRPRPTLERLGPRTFSIDLEMPQGAGSHATTLRDHILGQGAHVRWFIDGSLIKAVGRTALPASLDLSPDQIPHDANRHFVTANVHTSTDEVYTASMWLEVEDGTGQ